MFSVAKVERFLAFLMVILMLTGVGLAEESFNSDLLWLANSDAPLSATYEPEDLVKLTSRRSGGSTEGTVYTASTTSIRLRSEAAEALVRLCSAAEGEGIVLYVRQGYRSYEEEAKRYTRLDKRGEAMQLPGECDYQTGLAVTLVGEAWRSATLTEEFAETAEAAWLAEYAAAYGFVLRYPENKMEITGWEAEPWHLRYVGEEAAAYMAANDLCLEELWAEVMGDVPQAPVAEPEPTPEPTAAPTPAPAFSYVPGQVAPMNEFGPDGDEEISFIFE